MYASSALVVLAWLPTAFALVREDGVVSYLSNSFARGVSKTLHAT